MNLKKIFLLLISLPYILISNNDQLPVSFTDSLSNIKDMNELDFEITNIPNIDSLKDWESDLKKDKNIPDLYGYEYKVSYNIFNQGTWDTLHTGDLLWRMNIVCPGAYTVNFVFEELHLSENAHLSFYNEDKDFLLGPYTNRINKTHGIFSSHLIEGFSVFMELFVPKAELSENRFTLSKIEELTLYVIELKKENERIKAQLNNNK